MAEATDSGFTHPQFGKQVRLDQDGDEIKLTFVAGSHDKADALFAAIDAQLRDGKLQLSLLGKPTGITEAPPEPTPETSARVDANGRPWAGSYHAQRIIQQRVERVLRDKHPVDIGGALGTVMANIIADNSRDEAQAIAGLDAHASDMRDTIRLRFAPNGSAN